MTLHSFPMAMADNVEDELEEVAGKDDDDVETVWLICYNCWYMNGKQLFSWWVGCRLSIREVPEDNTVCVYFGFGLTEMVEVDNK